MVREHSGSGGAQRLCRGERKTFGKGGALFPGAVKRYLEDNW